MVSVAEELVGRAKILEPQVHGHGEAVENKGCVGIGLKVDELLLTTTLYNRMAGDRLRRIESRGRTYD